MFCKRCGNQLSDDSKFCKICGASVNNSNVQSTNNNYTRYDETIALNEENSILLVLAVINTLVMTLFFFVLGFRNGMYFIISFAFGLLSLLFVWWLKYCFVKYEGVCENCGNKVELKNNKAVCKSCNVEYKYNKNENIKNKKICKFGIILIILISIFGLVLGFMYDSPKNNQNASNSSLSKFNMVYTKNQIGLFTPNSVLEYYDDNGNLSKIQSSKFGEVVFSYLLDDKARVTKLYTNKDDSYISIDYVGNTNNINEIILYNTSVGEYSYNYIYAYGAKYPVITESYKDINSYYSKIIGQITFEEQELGSKIYITATETVEGKIKNKVLYEKNDSKNENIFSILGLLPDSEYINMFNKCYGNNFVILNGQIGTGFNPIYTFNFGKIIKSSNGISVTDYSYDINGKLLCEVNKDYSYYYKYEKVSDDVYTFSCLMNDSYSGKYYKQEGKIYYSNNEINKVEMTNEMAITSDEYNKNINDYKRYRTKNEVNLTMLN